MIYNAPSSPICDDLRKEGGDYKEYHRMLHHNMLTSTAGRPFTHIDIL